MWRLLRSGCHLSRRRLVGVREPCLRLEAAASHVSHQCYENRQDHDAGAGRSREPEVKAVRPEQQQRAVQGVHRVVPYQRGQNSPTQHDGAQHDSADPYFQPANVKRLLRIGGVAKAPNESRENQGRNHRAHQVPQERDGEHTEEEFFRDRRQETAKQHERPRKARVQQVGVRHIRRRPGSETVGQHVESDLVGDEDAGKGEPQNGAQEEALGANPARAKQVAQRYPATEGRAIEWLGSRGQHEQQSTGGKRFQHTL